MRSLRLSLALLGCLFGNVSASAQAAPLPGSDQSALGADMQWLHLIDVGDYQGAWNTAAATMQTAVAEPAFATAISGARSPLGAPGTRTFKQAEEKTQLPGAADGHYVVAQYLTHFANKAQALEIVITAQAPDGTWHVAGYVIQ